VPNPFGDSDSVLINGQEEREKEKKKREKEKENIFCTP